MINEIFCLHEVTVAEATGAIALWGCFQPGELPVWGAALTVRDKYQEWELLSLEAYHSTAAGLDYNGSMIWLVALQAPGGVIHMLPQTTQVQYMGQRVALKYPTFVTRGFAVLLGAGFIATDRIAVTAEYRMVKHG